VKRFEIGDSLSGEEDRRGLGGKEEIHHGGP